MQLLKVRILNSKKVIYDGAAISVSSKNSTGNFDVLPEHANFVTLLEDVDVIVRDEDNKATTLHLALGILYAAQDKVSIYIK
jgi:F0F1-type ATP synthase epsilon subunit